MKYIALIIFLSSCCVPRLNGPSADDLSGAPMVHDITLPYEPTLIPSDDWFPDENYIDTGLVSIILDLHTITKDDCNHLFVHIATPEKDSIRANEIGKAWITAEYRIPPDSIRVKAERPCVCIYCHEIKKCF